jgi:hypothetical protein
MPAGIHSQLIAMTAAIQAQTAALQASLATLTAEVGAVKVAVQVGISLLEASIQSHRTDMKA